jgi:hypothetical protein
MRNLFEGGSLLARVTLLNHDDLFDNGSGDF